MEGAGDADADGSPNYVDIDGDRDSIPDFIEGIVDTNGDGQPDRVSARQRR